jgi:hypothetical protein
VEKAFPLVGSILSDPRVGDGGFVYILLPRLHTGPAAGLQQCERICSMRSHAVPAFALDVAGKDTLRRGPIGDEG